MPVSDRLYRVEYGVERINAETSAWMRGCVHTASSPGLLGRRSLVWYRLGLKQCRFWKGYKRLIG